MKQILTAGVLALMIHGLFFCLDFNWPGRPSLENPVPLVLNMTLTPIVEKASLTPAPENEEPAQKKQTVVPKSNKSPLKKRTMTEKKRKPVVKRHHIGKKSKKQPKLAKYRPSQKTSPPKPAPIPPEPENDHTSNAVAENTGETATTDPGSKKDGAKTVSKYFEHGGASLSPLETIHEAKPVYRSNPSPKYPRIARIRGFQGTVLLNVLVNSSGKVDDVTIFKSSGHPVLDGAAESTVKQWLFEPGRIGKRKVDMWVRVPIRFELME